jgi:hypothetical protein
MANPKAVPRPDETLSIWPITPLESALPETRPQTLWNEHFQNKGLKTL